MTTSILTRKGQPVDPPPFINFLFGDKRAAEKEAQILRKFNSRLADRLTGMLLVPAGQRNKVF